MALLTDLLAALMVAFAVVGMLAVAFRARQYEMLGPTDGAVTVLGTALIVGMAVTTLL